MRPVIAVLLFLLGCRGAPEEALVPMTRRPPRDGGAPALSESALLARIQARWPGATIAPVPQMAPMDAVIVAVTLPDGGARTAAVDARGVTEGIAGAERVLRTWSTLGYEPFAEDLVRVVGAFAYPGATIFTARTVVEVDGAPRWTLSPTLAQRPGGNGRTLVFSYRLPGARDGLHVARFHLTASGVIVDEAPGARDASQR